jgi:uncharacterized protein
MSALSVAHLTDAPAFAARALPYLLDNEVEHNLLIGLALRAAVVPEAFDAPPVTLLVEADGEVAGAALQTPPLNLILSRFAHRRRAAALGALVEALDRLGHAQTDPPVVLPGVLGPAAEADAFAARWVRTRGTRQRLGRAERIYELTQVRMPDGVPGDLRPAGNDDLPLVASWIVAFHREALGEEVGPGTAAEVAAAWLAGGRSVYLWEDGGRAVCMVCAVGPTPHGIRIGPVYTPPEHRGHGYGSACTASVSQAQLDAGRSFCCLYTDLANPTSNHIYREIGYRPVADVHEFRFDGA